MLERLRRRLEETKLIPPGSTVLVGYSGGADSTCLLHLLSQLEVPVIAAHLNHGQRAEAAADERHCRKFAEQCGAPFASGKADVPRMSAELKMGLEEAGRSARYNFLEQTLHAAGADLIATGHTKTDQVETIIHHMARGAGISGLAGIPERRGNIVRPLLTFERGETYEYCRQHGFAVLDDPSNSDLSLSRARIRHRILPELQRVNPNVFDAVIRLSQIAADEDRFLNGLAAAALERSEATLNGELAFLTKDVELGLDRSLLLSHPAVLVSRGIRLAVEALGGALDYPQTVTVVSGLAALDKGSVTAEGGKIVVEWTQDLVRVHRLTTHRPFRWALEMPGETESIDLGWRLTASVGEPSGAPNTRAALRAELDPAQIKGNLYFRGWEPADRIQPLGFEGTRKVASLLSEAKLSSAAKQRLPIICDVLGPVWIPGVCLSGRVTSRNSSNSVISLYFEPVGRNRGHNVETLSTSQA